MGGEETAKGGAASGTMDSALRTAHVSRETCAPGSTGPHTSRVTRDTRPARGFTSFSLKAAAIVAMTANHGAYLFSDVLPFPAFCMLIAVGGMTFPIMAYLLVEGYLHTSNLRRYALRLGAFALVSQLPYGLFLGGNLNVLFTLLASLGLLAAHDRLANRAAFWALAAMGAIATLACDWGFIGPILVLIYRLGGSAPRQRIGYAFVVMAVGTGLPALGYGAAGLPEVLYAVAGGGAAALLLGNYNGQRGASMKWFFYAYYPAHIAALGLIRSML